MGLTGSIGMGKSAAANIFRSLGIPVFDSDKEAHNLLKNDLGVFNFIKSNFPEAIINSQISRQALGKLVFNNKKHLTLLETLLHPKIKSSQRRFISSAKNRNKNLIVLDIPLLFETGAEKSCDAVMVVTAPKEVQKERVLGRPNMTASKFEEILQNQMPDEEKKKKADHIIQTNLGLDKSFVEISTLIRNIKRRLKLGLSPIKGWELL